MVNMHVKCVSNYFQDATFVGSGQRTAEEEQHERIRWMARRPLDSHQSNSNWPGKAEVDRGSARAAAANDANDANESAAASCCDDSAVPTYSELSLRKCHK